MPDLVIDAVHRLSRHKKYGFVYTYNDDVIIPDDAPNEPHDDDEASDENNESDYVDTDSMSSMDNVDNPSNTDDASYGEPITGVEDHAEDPHHEKNIDDRHQGHPQETQ